MKRISTDVFQSLLCTIKQLFVPKTARHSLEYSDKIDFVLRQKTYRFFTFDHHRNLNLIYEDSNQVGMVLRFTIN